MDVLNILVTPAEVFQRIKEKPRWVLPFLLVAAGLTVISWLDKWLASEGLGADWTWFPLSFIGSAVSVLTVWLALSTFLFLAGILLMTSN